MYLSSCIEASRAIQILELVSFMRKQTARAHQTSSAVFNPTISPRTCSKSVQVIHAYTNRLMRAHDARSGFRIFLLPLDESMSRFGANVSPMMNQVDLDSRSMTKFVLFTIENLLKSICAKQN